MLKINNEFIDTAMAKLKMPERGRINYNLHKDYSEKLQRLLNIADANSYIRPHKHACPDKLEIFIVLCGRVVVLEFDDLGRVKDHMILDAALGNFAVEIAPKTWHSFISLTNGACLYEIKEGPYSPDTDKKFASWAPLENSPEGKSYNLKILAQLNIALVDQ